VHKLRKGQWVPVVMRITSIGVERVDATSGAPAQPISILCKCNATMPASFQYKAALLALEPPRMRLIEVSTVVARRSLCNECATTCGTPCR